MDDASPADLVLAGGAAGDSLPQDSSREERTITTDWQPGETWSVLTHYRNMAAPEGDTWSAPLTWEFEVTARTSLRDEEVLEVKVELGGRQAGELAPSYFYITPDRRLVALRNTVREQGEERSIYVFFDEDPEAAASGHFSIIPFDLPAQGTRARLAPAGSRIYDPVSRDALSKFPEPSRWIGAGGGYLEIEFPNRIDGTAIRQLWSEDDLRWPVVSITPSRRSYRVRP
ncbi:MAG: hypothetical protein HY720_13410 [Planctomycetes bacterium]|nr:hypothetical protein [Planctomycetota bacterium]